MLSRAESLDQLIILDRLFKESWRISQDALDEVKVMDSRALNMQHTVKYDFEIVSLIIRSLKKHYDDLLNDPIITQADVVCLQQTWLA